MPATVVYGGQFGDEGKGKSSQLFSDILNVDAVVRVGGSQADHKDISGNVFNVLPTCAGNRLSILPFGSFIRLDFLIDEIKRTGVTPENLWIDRHAWIIDSSSIKEATQSNRGLTISSHQLGTRNSVYRRLTGDIKSENTPEHYEELRPYIKNVGSLLYAMLEKGANILVEGTQGYGLSQHHFDLYPYTTSRVITPDALINEATICKEHYGERVMVIRTFPIRVAGNSGPLPNETVWDIVTSYSGSPTPLDEYSLDRNTGNKKLRRVAWFDCDIVRQCIKETQPTLIVLNMLDYIDYNVKYGRTAKVNDFINKLQHDLDVKIDYVGIDSKSIIKTCDL